MAPIIIVRGVLSVVRRGQCLLRAIERGLLAFVAYHETAAVLRRAVWFDGHAQPIESSAMNTMDEDAAAWHGANTYAYRDVSATLAFPDVMDAAEGIASATELYSMGCIAPKAVALAWRALKPNGRAYFFVWAGDWPLRGTGRAVADVVRGAFQANSWASDFVDEVASVFGRDECFADNNRNFVCAP
ncbi:hypothetical protein KFE25_006285 [Diacronema lutheri]|uniref:Uncharacterized protein n=1 Tax=Diacronema lutheri TaxID=2081491 RepID=A0A8J5XXP5_DIALT|nr:hypothetical protein KFE25_006285 [Diacronema lutheri]